MERAAADTEGSAIVHGVDPGAHFCQRIDDAAHRTPLQRLVAADYGFERVAGQDARHEPKRRPGIDRVERPPGRLQPADAASADDQGRRPCRPDGDAELAEARERGGAVRAGGVAVDVRLAVRQRRHHGVAVRNGFVAGDPHTSGGAGRRGHAVGVSGRAEHPSHYSIRTLGGIRFSMLFTRVHLESAFIRSLAPGRNRAGDRVPAC